jgi:hypothetical protein
MRNARSLGTVLGFLLCWIPVVGFAQSEDIYDYSVARLNFVRGDVSVERGSDLGTEKGEVNLPLVAGDALVTGDGQAEIHFGKKNYLRIDADSRLELVALPEREDEPLELHLIDGSVLFRVSVLSGEKGIEVHTSDASLYILEEGLYRVDTGAGTKTEFEVFEGSAEAAGEGDSVIIHAREKLLASDGELESAPEFASAELDEFGGWNASRDDLLGRKSVSAYLPTDISEYEEELDDSGRWVYEQPYGYVWTPWAVQQDWRPYTYGRWVWYPVFGWTWVSSESWGWCTSHYGRWQWRLNLGWYWIPRAHWGPAWVHWYWDNDYVGWCPLGFHNRPGIIVNNRFYDRYGDDDYPAHSRALTMIRRNQLQSRDVHRNALGASGLRSIGRISLRAHQPDVRPLAGGTGLRAPAGGKTTSLSGRRTVLSSGGKSTGIREFKSGGNLSGRTSGSLRNTRSLPSLRTYPSRGAGSALSGRSGALSGLRVRRDSTQNRSSAKENSRITTRGLRSFEPKSGSRSLSTFRGTSENRKMSGTSRAFPSRIRSNGASSGIFSRSGSGASVSRNSAFLRAPSLRGSSVRSSFGSGRNPGASVSSRASGPSRVSGSGGARHSGSRMSAPSGSSRSGSVRKK